MWRARAIASGRIIFDEVLYQLEDGTEIARLVTLRTYSPTTERWEITFLNAHQPAMPISFGGRRVDHEIHLEARSLGVDTSQVLAQVRFFAIEADGFQWEQKNRPEGAGHLRKSVEIQARRKSDTWTLTD